MSRLIVNPDTPEAWAIEISSDEISLGRGPENTYPIEHPTISSSHCSLIASGENLKVKDLGSTGGTYLEGELIETGLLRPGQTLRLGEVSFRFESDLKEPPPPLPAAASIPTATAGTPCRAHPRTLARFQCPKCGGAFCGFCVDTHFEHGVPHKLCRTCGVVCASVEIEEKPERPTLGFFASLPGALIYPFTGNGVILMVAGTIFFIVMSYFLLLALSCTGYLFGYAKHIVASSAAGEDEPPDWPDFTDWKEDMLWPYLQLLALIVLTFSPAILLLIFPPDDKLVFGGLMLAALALGAAIAPMGMLALSMFDTVTALNPVGLVWSILRIPGPYLVAALAFEAVIGVNVLKNLVLMVIIPSTFVAVVVASFLNLYFIMVGMRILGLLFYTQEDRLGWFSRLTPRKG